jgi:AI-2 transport protein TqsA
VVVPRLLGRRVSIAPFWGMLSLVFWGWLLGPAGAILAVPLTMLAKFMLEGSPATEWLGRLMSPLQPRERAPAG